MRIGRHEFSIDNDLVFIRWVGSPAAPEIREMQAQVERVAKEYGFVYMLLDMSQAEIPDAEARRVSSDWAGHHLIRGLAHYGQSWPIRMVETLILRGIQLLGKQLAPTVFAKDEREARDWLAGQRAAWHSQAPSPR